MKSLMKNSLMLLMAFGLLFSLASEAKQTEYYTMVNSSKVRKDCNGEGNQIVNGRLIGSDCKPVKKYCPWGVGNSNNCIVPCVHGAGHRSQVGKTVAVKGFRCKWGPFEGQWITKIRVADVGGAVGRGHTDVFMGLCKEKKMVKTRRGKWVDTGICKTYAGPGAIASYGTGRGREQQVAQALADYYKGGSTVVANVSPSSVEPSTADTSRSTRPRLVVVAPSREPSYRAPITNLKIRKQARREASRPRPIPVRDYMLEALGGYR